MCCSFSLLPSLSSRKLHSPRLGIKKGNRKPAQTFKTILFFGQPPVRESLLQLIKFQTFTTLWICLPNFFECIRPKAPNWPGPALPDNIFSSNHTSRQPTKDSMLRTKGTNKTNIYILINIFSLTNQFVLVARPVRLIYDNFYSRLCFTVIIY